MRGGATLQGCKLRSFGLKAGAIVAVAVSGGTMDQQLELLSTDRTRHNVYLAALPDAPMAACAEEIAGNMRRRFGLTARPISPEHFHVSLLAIGDFSGSCPPAAIDAASGAGGTVSMAPLKMFAPFTFDLRGEGAHHSALPQSTSVSLKRPTSSG